MDLHLLKRGSLTPSNEASEAGAKYQDTASVSSQGNQGGQSYELIKSTQV